MKQIFSVATFEFPILHIFLKLNKDNKKTGKSS